MLNLLETDYNPYFVKCSMEYYFKNIKVKKSLMPHKHPNKFNLFLAFSSCFEEQSFFDKSFSGIEQIKIQELTFLSEYFLMTALFCLTLFALFSLRFFSKNEDSSIKFLYDNQIVFLVILILACYLALVSQQADISFLSLTSFNDTIQNDPLALFSKWIIGISSILYLIFINKYLKDQKLNNFEYYIILLTSIFGFFLLCSANDLITAYLAIELQGLAFYVLASFKKSSNFSVESGVKYFVLGSLSTALFLLGITMIYGLSGSILLTDFKDFFIWVFSTSSFFFSLDSFTQAFELFQEKTSVDTDSEVLKLKVMSDKLSVLGQNASFSTLEMDALKPTFEHLGLNFADTPNVEFSTKIAERFLEYYNESDASLFLGSYGASSSIDSNFLQASILISSINDFLVESSYQNGSLDFLYILRDTSLDSSTFGTIKSYVFESGYYENVELEKLLELSPADSSFVDVSKSFKEVPLADLEHVATSESERLQNISSTESYAYSITQITNMNFFFSETFKTDTTALMPIFDLNFVVAGLLLILLALFFKLALAPFHLWAPDIYEGSPSSSTFFFMVISKVGIFVFLLRLCYFSFYSLISYWQFYSIIVASVSIFVGAVAGLKQRKLKSLLTYSSINNMGFVLLAFSVGGFEGIQVKFYFLIVYMLASICIWSIILNLQLKKKSDSDKQNRDLGDLALIQESNSIVAQSLGITLFSLAGLPPMVGFLAKMGVFKALSGISVYYFSVINILFSVIATFYYLRITKIIFFENILVGNLYVTISSKKVFIINLLTFLLVFLFFNPMFLYLYSYKITLFLNKSFF